MNDIRAVENAQTSRGRVYSLIVSLGDQGAQSIVNLLLAVLAARALSAEDFGRFGIVLALMISTWAVARSFVVEPFLIVKAATPTAEVEASYRNLLKALIAVVCPAAVAFLLAAWFTTGVWQLGFAFASAALPLIAALECGRATAIAANRKGRTLAVASVWVASMFIGAVLYELVSSRIETILASFLVATALAACVAFVDLTIRRSPSIVHGDVFGYDVVRSLGLPLALEVLLTVATVQALVPVVGLVVDLDSAAGVRGAWTVAGPITTLVAGLRLGLLADATRQTASIGSRGWRSYFLQGSLLLTAAAFPATIVVWLGAARFGTNLLGASWPATETLVVPMLLASLAATPHLVGASIMRARRRTSEVLRLRVKISALVLTLELAGVFLGGAQGAVWGLLTGVCLATPLWYKASVRD